MSAGAAGRLGSACAPPEEERGGDAGQGGSPADDLSRLQSRGYFNTKKLAKKPGYMTMEAQQEIELQTCKDCKLFTGHGEHGRTLHNYVRKNSKCKNNDLESLHPSYSVNSTIVTTGVVTDLTLRVENQTGSPKSVSDHRLTQSALTPFGCLAGTCNGGVPSVNFSKSQHLYGAGCESVHADQGRQAKAMNNLGLSEVNKTFGRTGRETSSPQLSPPGSFHSNFSFIQLSMKSGFSSSETDGRTFWQDGDHVLPTDPTPKNDDNTVCLQGQVQGSHSEHLCQVSNASSSWRGSGSCMGSPLDHVASDKVQDFELLSFSHTEAAFPYSTEYSDAASAGSSVTSGYESSRSPCDYSWETLIQRYEPILSECLLSNKTTLEIMALILKLQRLQEKAIREDDYDNAEKLRRRLEDLGKKKKSSMFQLPSTHPSICSLLERFRAEVQAALCRTANGVKHEQKCYSSSNQGTRLVLTSRRDALLQERQQLQEEIETLRVRLAALQTKDEQLREEIEEQDRLIRCQDCELTSLITSMPFGKLHEINKALDDTLTSACHIPLSLQLPGPLKSLQEKEELLSLSVKEMTARVYASQKLCSSLRRKVSDIETQLPSIREAQMFAVSGNDFCNAKELTNEIRSLVSEKQGLEGLLKEALVLSAKNGKKFVRSEEDHIRLKKELEQQETVFEKNLQDLTVKYIEILEGRLQSCGSPLLEKVWEADLEACQMLVQGLQLKHTGYCAFSKEDVLTDDAESVEYGWLETEDRKEVPYLLFSKCEVSQISTTQQKLFKPKEEEVHTSPGSQESQYSLTESENLKEYNFISLDPREKCEVISVKLVHLEDQLRTAVCNRSEGLVQSLQREIQMVKETLQVMLVQLQTAALEGEDEGEHTVNDSCTL